MICVFEMWEWDAAFLPNHHIIETSPQGHPFTGGDGCEFLGVESEASTLITLLNRVFSFFLIHMFFLKDIFQKNTMQQSILCTEV